MIVMHVHPVGWVDTNEAGLIQPSEVSGLEHQITLPTLEELGAAASGHTHTAGDVGAMATSHAANVITGLGAAAAALGASAAGTATTVSRSDHVHALPSLATLGAAASGHTHTAAAIGAMATSHAANAITGLGTAAAALGTSAAGVATTVSRSDHVHALPSLETLGAAAASHTHTAGDVGAAASGHTHTAGDVGAMATSHAANVITGLGAAAAALGASAAGTATTVSRSDHVHALPSLATLGAAASGHTHTAAAIGAMATSHAANAITGLGASSAALGTSAAGVATTVSRSDHVHAMPTAANVGAAAASHSHVLAAGAVGAFALLKTNVVIAAGASSTVTAESLIYTTVGGDYLGAVAVGQVWRNMAGGGLVPGMVSLFQRVS